MVSGDDLGVAHPAITLVSRTRTIRLIINSLQVKGIFVIAASPIGNTRISTAAYALAVDTSAKRLSVASS
jgi:hypothetical protein